MFEDGFVAFVQSAPSVANLSTGGFLRQLPPSFNVQSTPAWTWFFVTNHPDTGLQFPNGMIRALIQIDVYGMSQTSVSPLSYAIDLLLQGYVGPLGDADGTTIQGCLRTDLMDEPFDPDSRVYRRMLEYEVFYYAGVPS